MNEYLIPLLMFTLLIGIGWALRRRPRPLLWRSHEYRAVLDILEDAILVYNKGGQLIYLNRTARTWFGLDKAESYATRLLRSHIRPLDDFDALLSHSGRAALKIGSRHVEAASHRVKVDGIPHITLVLHDVTALQDLLAEERQRVRELAVYNEINQAINTSVTPDELLANILSKLEDLVPYTSAAISLWDPKLAQLVVQSCAGPLVQLNDVRPSDHGYAARLIQEQKPLLLEDTSQHPELDDDPDFGVHNHRVHSYVGVPLMAGVKFIGTLELASDQVNTFSTHICETLRIVAIQAGVAIENARLHRETLIRTAEMDTLNMLSAILTASLNPDELLETIIYTVSQAIECNRSAIFIMDNERGVLNLARARGLSEEYIRRSQNLKPELDGQGQVVLDRYPLVVSDIRQTPALAHLVSLAEREGFVAFADLPLRGREHVLGALTVYYDQPHTFDESELELLRTFTNQVTLALENARLHERTDRALARRVDQLAAIEEIGRELTSTLDVTRVFNLVLERAMGMTGASAGLLAVCDPAHDELELIAKRGYPPEALEHYRHTGWSIGQGIIRRVAHTGETALVNDVHADPDYVLRLATTSAQLAVPIIKEARVLGVVSLESSRPQGFSPDDERFATQLAEMAAIAIDNAHLFQQVSQGRDNLQAILDSTHEGILVIDQDARIALANPMIEKLSGLSAQNMVGQRVSDVAVELGHQVASLLGYTVGELDEALELLSLMSDTVSKRTYEVPGSPSRYIEQVASPVIDKNGAVTSRLIVFRDITEERRLTRMRQDLTDMIIHDLRSPLTAVVGGVQVAGDLVDASANPTAIHRALEMADLSCARLMTLVDSLLDISRLEFGQMPMKRQAVLLPQLAQAVIQQMRPLAEREMVTLQLHPSPHIPPVYADSELISRVLVNLVDNALKHSPRRSAVTIKIVPDSATGEQNQTDLPAKSVRCMVLDIGPGIPVESRERIFDRFAQLDGRRRGKGLGLTFCKLTVQGPTAGVYG